MCYGSRGYTMSTLYRVMYYEPEEYMCTMDREKRVRCDVNKVFQEAFGNVLFSWWSPHLCLWFITLSPIIMGIRGKTESPHSTTFVGNASSLSIGPSILEYWLRSPLHR